ncbi:syntaxin-8 [Ixodes scapularis]
MAFSMRDPWLSAHDACEAMAREIMEQIVQRNQYARQTSAHIQATSKIRQSLGRYRNEVSKLTAGLTAASDSFTVGEADRRKYMISTLVNKGREMEDLLTAKQGSTGQARRSELFGSDFGATGVSEGGWNAEETEATQDLTVGEIKEQQQKALREQDRGLEGLSHVIGRQKEMAIGFNQELTLHNEIIDDIADHTDRMRDRLVRETKNVQIVDRKSGTCWYWVAILVLMVAIVVIAAAF